MPRMLNEVLKFPTDCPSCGASTTTDSCVIDIPHFKEAIIMSLACEKCGFKSNDVKGGGEILPHGTIITLRAETLNDMSRDVIKSDTACVALPEIEFELQESGLGLCTTVEGLLLKMHDDLKESNPFASAGDGSSSSSSSTTQDKFEMFLTKLKSIVEGKCFPFTLVITDPLSNSFVGPIPENGEQFVHSNYPIIPHDKGITIEEFQRSHEQNENLGLNDVRT